MSKVKKLDNNDDANVIFDEDKKRKKKKRKSASSKYYNLPEEELQEIISAAKEEIFWDKLPRVKADYKSNLTPKEKEQFLKRFNLDEEKLEKMLATKRPYIRPKTDARNELLKIFDNFITKYVALLFYGRYDLHDYDIRRFILLFVTDGDTKMRLRYNKVNYKTFKNVGEVMSGITMMVARYGDEEDVKQAVQMSFLHCVDKYKRQESIPFSGYIYNYMFYILQKDVEVFLIDQLGRKSFPLYTDDAVSSAFTADGDDRQYTNVYPEAPSIEDMLGPEEIDEYWVLGETAVFPFDSLSIHQRQLLKWRYVDNIKASQIAIRTTEHPNTCRAQLQEIKVQITELIENEFYV